MGPLRRNQNTQLRHGHDSARIIAELEMKGHALKAKEVAALLRVTAQHIYKLAAQQLIPSFRVGGAVRFDPIQIADWIRRKMPQAVSSPPKPRSAGPMIVEPRIVQPKIAV
jgi:excisionase family DNA binding protein